MRPIHKAALQKVARLIRLGYSIRGSLDGETLAALNEIPWEGTTSLVWVSTFASMQADPEAGSSNEPALWKAFAAALDKGELEAALTVERKFVKMHVRKGRVLRGDRDAGPWGD